LVTLHYRKITALAAWGLFDIITKLLLDSKNSDYSSTAHYKTNWWS